jgi:hypothetical protein
MRAIHTIALLPVVRFAVESQVIFRKTSKRSYVRTGP